MQIKVLALLIWIGFNSPYCTGEYLSIGGGMHAHRLNYLPDTSERNTEFAQLELDTTKWRRQPTGLLARGVGLKYQQGSQSQQLELQLPLYQWHPLHGLGLNVQQAQVTTASTVSETQSYLGDSGSPVDIAAGSSVASTWQLNRYQLYWRSDARHSGAANRAGVYWQRLTNPVEAELTNVTPTLFDLESEGFGFYVGRTEDDKGWNTSWQLLLGQQTNVYSDANTQSHQISESERRMILLEASVQWHYRYYLAPYWYLVPALGWQLQLLSQAKSASEQVEQKTLIYGQANVALSLRYYF